MRVFLGLVLLSVLLVTALPAELPKIPGPGECVITLTVTGDPTFPYLTVRDNSWNFWAHWWQAETYMEDWMKWCAENGNQS